MSRARSTEPTGREIQALRMLASGATTGQIATQLGVSIDSVYSYFSRLYKKIGARSAPHAVAIAYETGIFPHGMVKSRVG